MFPLSTGILAGRLAARYTQRSQFFSKAIRRTMVHWDLAISEKAHHIFWYQLDPIDTVCPPDVDVCLICPYVLPADIYAVKHPEWHDWSRIGQHDTCRGKRSKHMPEFQSNSLHLSSSIDHPHHILPYCPVTPDTYLHSVLQLLYPPLTHTYTASCNYSIPPPLTILVQWNPLSVPNTCKTNTKTLQVESFLTNKSSWTFPWNFPNSYNNI